MGFLQSAAAFLIVISFYSACADFCDHRQHSEKTNQTTACCGSESTRIAPTWAAASGFDTDQQTFTQIDQPPFGWANYNQLVIQSHLKATMPEVPGPWKCMYCKKNCESQRRVLSEVLVPLATCMGHQFCPRGTPARTESQSWNWKNEETSSTHSGGQRSASERRRGKKTREVRMRGRRPSKLTQVPARESYNFFCSAFTI